MKIYWIPGYFWVLVTFFSGYYVSAQTQWAVAPSGLNVREQPSLGAPVVGKLAYGDSVNVVQAVGDEFSLTECAAFKIKGEWLEIQWQAFSGYVFSGYMLPFAPIAKYAGDEFGEELDSYVNQNFSHELEPEVIATQPGCETCMLEYRQVFDNGVVMQVRSPEAKGHGGTIFIPRQVMTLGQVYLLVFVAALNSGSIVNDRYEPPIVRCSVQEGKTKLETESGMGGLEAEIFSKDDGYLIDFWYISC